MGYCVRVDFPDEDMYTFLVHESGFNQGQLIIFNTLEQAKAQAKKYPGGIVLAYGTNYEKDKS